MVWCEVPTAGHCYGLLAGFFTPIVCASARDAGVGLGYSACVMSIPEMLQYLRLRRTSALTVLPMFTFAVAVLEVPLEVPLEVRPIIILP